MATGEASREPLPAAEERIVFLPAFTCIGLQAEGPIDGEFDWITELWIDFHDRCLEIRSLGCLGVWGLCSDPDTYLGAWNGKTGLYLAGCHVPEDTLPFDDWKVWRIPAGHWLRETCTIDQISSALDRGKARLLSDPDWTWAGVAHEFYPPSFRHPGRDELHLLLEIRPRPKSP